jgi:hypothetical protein
MKYLFLFFAFVQLNAFQKVVIWGHKLHSHTHSYVHNAFYRAFQSLDYETYWFDDKDDVSDFDFSNCLFLTEGQADQNIPIRLDCMYILHNARMEKYKALGMNNYISLQVYTDDVLNQNILKIAPCIHFDIKGRTVYMPWATDLLPNEIDQIIAKIPQINKKSKIISWVGTIGKGLFGNSEEIDPFKNEARKLGYKFVHKINLSLEENIKLVQASFIAPAIVGTWQKEKGYIPCRIFKNISYGKLGVTNSERVSELFEGRIVYNSDTSKLFHDALKRVKNISNDELKDLVLFVRDKHTYVNRIHTLLDFFESVNKESLCN